MGNRNIIVYSMIAAASIVLAMSQACSQNASFRSKQHETPRLVASNGEGHEGKPSVPIDYVSDLSNQDSHYQEEVNFGGSGVSGNGVDLDGIQSYCRSSDSTFSEGADVILTVPPSSLNFSGSEAYDFSQITSSGVRVERASSATAWNASGQLVSYAANEPRLGVIGASGAKGLLLESSATNLIFQSEDFNQTPWGVNDASIEVSTVVNPTGTGTALRLAETAATGAWRYMQQDVTMIDNSDYTFSAFVKAISPGREVSIRLYDKSGTTFRCSLNFETEQITKNSSAKPFDCLLIKRPGGWYRLAVKANAGSGSQGPRLKIELFHPVQGGVYTPEGHPGVAIWGAQLEVGNQMTSYISSGATNGVRAADTAYIRESGAPLNGTLQLAVQLENGNSVADLNLLGGDVKLVSMKEQQVSSTAGTSSNTAISSDFSGLQNLMLRLSTNSIAIYDNGRHILNSNVSGNSIQTVQVSASTGGIVVSSMGLQSVVPTQEILSTATSNSTDASDVHAVLVLGRQAVLRERIQSKSIPIESLDQGYLAAKHHLMEMIPIAGNQYQLNTMLDDNSFISSIVDCQNP